MKTTNKVALRGPTIDFQENDSDNMANFSENMGDFLYFDEYL